MAVVQVSVTVDYDGDPMDRFSSMVVFDQHYVIGRKLSRKGYSIIGHIWHIVGANIDRWSTGSPVPLCSGFVGYHGRQPMSVKGMSLAYDRICKTCLKSAEAKARARGMS
jgi:hypothetical protein